MAETRTLLIPLKKAIWSGLEEILELRDPLILKKKFKWKGYNAAGILHIAAHFNQPDLIEFLVTEKGMDIDKAYYTCTPLSYVQQRPVHPGRLIFF